MAEKEAGKQACPRAPPPFPPPNCPRCYSGNTKFCYYNNYSILQPRYLCKTCRRYWTHGGVLRNIPSGGIRRKRVRNDSSSSSSQIPKPPPSVLSIRSAQNHASVGGGSSHGVGAFKPEFTQNMRSFNNDSFFYRPPSRLNPNSAFLGGANAGFDAVNVAFGVGVTPQPASLTVTLPQLSSLNGLGGFNVPFVQQSLQHQPPTAWAGQNTGHMSILPDDFLAMARDVAATANEVNIDEWSELLDMDHVGDPHQSCKPPSP